MLKIESHHQVFIFAVYIHSVDSRCLWWTFLFSDRMFDILDIEIILIQIFLYFLFG